MTTEYETRELFGKRVTIQIDSDVFPTDDQIAAMDAVTGPNCQHGWYEGAGATEPSTPIHLHYRYWLPKGDDLKGIVVFTMGILSQTAHALRLKDGRSLDVALVVDTFLAKGMAVYARDQYGHGLSEGTRFYIPSWTDAVDDAVSFVQLVARQHPTKVPLFLMGESFGGCLTILTAKHFQENPEEAPPNFDSSLLVCPAIVADLPPLPVYMLLRYVLAPLAPTWAPSFMPDTVGPERIWRDAAVLQNYQDPAFLKMGLDACGVKLRLGTAVSMLCAMDSAKTFLKDFSTPFCIVHGDQDAGVPVEGSKFMFETSATPAQHKEFHPLEGAFHGVLADPKAEEAMQHLADFVDARVRQFVPPKEEEYNRAVF